MAAAAGEKRAAPIYIDNEAEAEPTFADSDEEDDVGAPEIIDPIEESEDGQEQRVLYNKEVEEDTRLDMEDAAAAEAGNYGVVKDIVQKKRGLGKKGSGEDGPKQKKAKRATKEELLEQEEEATLKIYFASEEGLQAKDYLEPEVPGFKRQAASKRDLPLQVRSLPAFTHVWFSTCSN